MLDFEYDGDVTPLSLNSEIWEEQMPGGDVSPASSITPIEREGLKATRTLGREGPVQLLTRGVSRYLEGREDLSGFAGDERAGFGVCAGERWGLVLAGERNPSPRGGKGVGFGSVFEFVLSQRVVMGLRPVTFSRAMTSWPLQHHAAEEYFSFLVESWGWRLGGFLTDLKGHPTGRCIVLYSVSDGKSWASIDGSFR